MGSLEPQRLFDWSDHGLSSPSRLTVDLGLRFRVLFEHHRGDVVGFFLEVSLFCLDARLIPSFLLHFVLLLEANFVIEGAGHEVGRNAVLCNSRLASLPVQEMVGRAGEAALLRLVARIVLWMLEVYERAAEIWLRSESCCLFQCYGKIKVKKMKGFDCNLRLSWLGSKLLLISLTVSTNLVCLSRF